MKMYVWTDKWTPRNRIAVVAETHDEAFILADKAVAAAMKSGDPEDTERYLRWDQSGYVFQGEKTVLM